MEKGETMVKGYSIIKQYPDDVEGVIDYLIEEAAELSKKLNNNNLVLGVDCSINPEFDGLEEVVHNTKAMWAGFLRDDVKIVYKFIKDDNGYTVNEGCYYYMDDNKYLYDFGEYIKDKKIENDYEFLDCIIKFLDSYLYNELDIAKNDTDVYPIIYDSRNRVIDSIGRHSISDFYSDNSAQCSEYSAMASNILSVFGYDVLYLGGSVNCKSGSGGHAYNIAILDDGYAIIDFSVPVSKSDITGNIIGCSPFIGFLEEDSMGYISSFAISHEPIDLTDYEIVRLTDNDLFISNGDKRHYVIGNVNYYDNKKYVK